MKLSLATLALLILLAGGAFLPAHSTHAARPLGAADFTAQDAPMAGGYREASTGDADVRSAARYAVAARSRRQGTRITLVSVERAEKQAAAGINYRLGLRVRAGGRLRSVTAVVYKDLRQRLSLSSWETAVGTRPPAGREVRVYLVAIDDDGRSGKKIGCGDSLVAVTRPADARTPPLRAALQELLSIPQDFDGRLKNFWVGRRLRVRSVSQRAGFATIHISGEGPFIAGVCDAPRITEQIEETARQFPAVRSVKVFVNGRPLARALR